MIVFCILLSKTLYLQSCKPPIFFHFPMQNVIQASLVPAVNSHVIVQVEGHVTLRPECAAKDVLLGFRGTSVNWVSKTLLSCVIKDALTYKKIQKCDIKIF